MFSAETILYFVAALACWYLLLRALMGYAGEFAFLRQAADREARATQWLFLAPFVLLAAALLSTGGKLSYSGDWLVYYNYHLLVAESLRQGDLMHWSSTLSGGFPFAGHPESPGVSPVMLIALLLGEVVGIKVTILLLYLLMVLGIFLLARRHLGFSVRGGALLSSLALVSTVLAGRVVTAKYTNLFELLIPLVLFFYLESLHALERSKRLRAVGACAILLAMLLVQGKIGLVNTALFMTGIFVYAMVRADHAARRRILLASLAVAGLFLLLAAPKILPMLDLLRIDARYIESFERLRNHILEPRTLFMALITYGYNESGWIFNNQIIGLGVLPLGVGIYGVATGWRQNLGWLALLVIFCFIVLGDNGWIPLGYWLWHLPLFHSMEDLDRYYTFFIMLCIALLAVRGVERIVLRPVWGAGLAWGLVAAMLLPLLAYSFDLHRHAFRGTPLVPAVSRDFHFAGKSEDPRGWGMLGHDYLYALRGIGVLNGYTNLRYPSAAQARYQVEPNGTETPNPDYRGEVFLLEGEGSATLLRHTQNALQVQVRADTPVTVGINQSASPYWRVSHGQVVEPESKLLKIRLEQAGAYTLEIRNVNPWFRAGCGLGLTGVLLLLLGEVGRRRLEKGP